MKSYTDIKQSKRLAEILPIDSADMCYRIVAYNSNDTHEYQPYCFVKTLESDIPCWSLAALLEILPDEIIDDNGDKIQIDIRKYDLKYLIAYRNDLNWSDTISTGVYENFVDACYEIILKLHEEKLL